MGRRARPRARAAPHPVRRRARRRPDRRRRLHRPQVAVHGRAQPALRRARRRRRPGARAHRRSGHHGPPRGARARLRNDRRAELDLGQAGVAHAHGVRPRRASPPADRADAAPLTGAGDPQPRRVGAPREVRRLGVPQARAGRRRRSRSMRARGDRGLRGAHHRAGGPSAVLAPGCGRRAARARVEGCAGASREPSGPRGRGARRGASALGQTATASGRAHATRSRGAAPRRQGPHDGPDRRSARHLSQDRRPPHPAHLRQDRHVDRAGAALWAMQHAVVQ